MIPYLMGARPRGRRVSVGPNPGGAEPFFSDSFDTGDTSHTEGGFEWGWKDFETSTLIKRTGTHSMVFRYPPGTSNIEQRFSHPPLTEYWVQYYVYFPDGTEDDGEGGTLNRFEHSNDGGATNNKFYSFWEGEYTGAMPRGNFSTWYAGGLAADDPSDPYMNVACTFEEAGELTAGQEYVVNIPREALYPGTGWDHIEWDFVTDTERGTWVQVRIHIKVSDVGQKNGALQMWKNGSLIIDVRDIGFEDPAGVTNYLDAGALFGYANTQYVAETLILIDDFEMYDSDPGWS